MHWAKLGRMIIVLTFLASFLTACNYRDYFQKYSGYDYGSRPDDGKNAASPLLRAKSHTPADPKQHENKQLTYSHELSKRIASTPGIYTAFVFVTDRNAYVGIITDLSATGTRASGTIPEEQNNIGTADGAAGAGSGSPQGDYRTLANLYSFYFTHKDVNDISSRLRDTIAAKIRRAEPKVKNVYVSANREYVNQLIEYAKESWAGRPLTPWIPEFNRLVQFVFGGGEEVPLPLYELRMDRAVDSAAGTGHQPGVTGGQ